MNTSTAVMTMATMITSGTAVTNMSSDGTIPNDIHDHRGLHVDHNPWSAVAIIEGITIVVIFVGALFANLMAMTTILTDKVLRRNLHNVLILNLTMMDLGVTITSMSLSIWSIYDNGYLLVNNDALCTINGFGATLFTFGNFTTILAISLDRYLTVCWSTRFPPTKHRAIALVVFCWALPIINVIPPTFEVLSDFRYHPDTHHCSPAWDACLYFIIWFTFIFGITVPVMAFCYFNVMLTIRRQELQMKSHQGALRGKKSSVLNAGMTSDSGVGNISMDTVSISQTVNMTDDPPDVPSVGQSNILGTDVTICPINIVSRAPDDASDDASNQPSGSGDAADVLSERDSGPTAEDAGKSTGKTAKSIWNKKKRAKNLMARLNQLSVDKQIAMTGILLVLTTLVCWTPYFIIHSCFIPIDPPHWLGVVSMWLGYTNSLLDPLVYAFMNRRLRARYSSLIGCRDCARYDTDL